MNSLMMKKEAFKEACSGIYDEYADVVGQDVIDLFRGQNKGELQWIIKKYSERDLG